MPDRKAGASQVERELGLDRPLTARSVLASTLLGAQPPVLGAGRLVETAALFGIGEGAARTALSRMAASGEVVAEGGRYRLTGRLLERQARLGHSRRPQLRPWSGAWQTAVVVVERRSPADRAGLRAAMAAHRLAELREGVWLRPDNLPVGVREGPAADQCRWFLATADGADDADLAATLWDLDGWARGAAELHDRLAATHPRLAAGDTSVLAPGFVLSAAVLRHLQADPLLPTELLPARWPGAVLRAAYERWDETYRQVLAAWHRAPDPDRGRSDPGRG